MAGSRRRILGHVVSGVCYKMGRTKRVDEGGGGEQGLDTPLRRCLNTWDLTLLGIGHMVGAGVYVLTGPVARDLAGPAIVLSFLLAGLASLLAAFCYAEFGARVPRAGSAYVYTYVCVGEFWAFVIGWTIVLEHVIGAASVARAWSGYVDGLAGGALSNWTSQLLQMGGEETSRLHLDLVAALVCLLYAALLAIGVKASSLLNSALTAINMAVVLLVIVLGFVFAPGFENWTLPGAGFMPFGWSGVLAGGATCFYAFVGFDSVASAGEEAREPRKSIPIAIIVSLAVVMIGYMLVSASLTLMVPFTSLVPEAALPAALQQVGLGWARYAVSAGALCGMTTTLLGSLFALPRILYAMAADGLLFARLAKVNPTTQLPLLPVALGGLGSALTALVLDLETLVEFMSLGTLMAYTIVSAGVVVLRYRPSNLEDPGHGQQDSGLSEDEPDTKTTEDNPQQQEAAVGCVHHRHRLTRRLLGSCRPGRAVTGAVVCFMVTWVVLLCSVHPSTLQKPWQENLHRVLPAIVAYIILALAVAMSVWVIYAHRASDGATLRFRVPLVPLVPLMSVACNLTFMAHLGLLTWLRFAAWMAIGLLVYFAYGMRHSKEGEAGCSASAYSELLGSAEAGKGAWGACSAVPGSAGVASSSKQQAHNTRAAVSTDDKRPIVDEEEVPE